MALLLLQYGCHGFQDRAAFFVPDRATHAELKAASAGWLLSYSSTPRECSYLESKAHRRA